MNSVILKAAARLLGGIVLMFAVYLLWRGHHSPGGGFIAALVAATGFSVVLLSEGPETVRKGLYFAPQHLVPEDKYLLPVITGGYPAADGKPVPGKVYAGFILDNKLVKP